MGIVKEWESHGLLCRVLDGPFSNYNGYVAVSKSHPYWGKEYSDIHVSVHGGLTFGSQGGETTRTRKVLGKDREFKNDAVQWPNEELWWFGWDTSHYDDYIVYKDGSSPDPSGICWTVEMVARETDELAKQLSEMI